MTLDELLQMDRQHASLTPHETHICETVDASRASFLRAESERPLSRTAFLAAQLALIQKRWWLAQALLLVLVAILLPGMAEIGLLSRSLGVTAALFVILVIPEFARNSSANAMEIEGTTHYTLRHIYAARLVLFGSVDLVILTGFCSALTLTMNLPLITLVTQFLLPLVITAVLCFGILSRPYSAQGPAAICTALFWSGMWWLIVTNERLYAQIATPLWLVLFALSLLMLVFFARRFLKNATKQWEGPPHGTLYD